MPEKCLKMPQNPTRQMHALLAAVITMSGMRQEDIILRHRNGSFRLVSHYWIDDAAAEKTINLMQQLLV